MGIHKSGGAVRGAPRDGRCPRAEHPAAYAQRERGVQAATAGGEDASAPPGGGAAPTDDGGDGGALSARGGERKSDANCFSSTDSPPPSTPDSDVRDGRGGGVRTAAREARNA